MKNTQAYIQENKQKFLDELLDLLRIPSISADAAYANEVYRTAEEVEKHLISACAENV